MRIIVAGSPAYDDHDSVFLEMEGYWRAARGEVVEVCHVVDGVLLESLQSIVADNARFGIELRGAEPADLDDYEEAIAFLLRHEPVPVLMEHLSPCCIVRG